ncbi:MAG: sigma-70 family RNA polymerase sigma factor, partial [Patescibacteria group bacterium]|nr:sigma-70 family RNA polymerase sigma factor [Patescibacteria group bacterium]
TFFPHPVAKETAEGETERNEAKKIVSAGLERLDAKYREVLVLFYLEELSYKEISDVLKVPIATVGVRIKRAKEALKAALEH